MTSDSAARPPLDSSRLIDGDPALMPELSVEVVQVVASTNAALADRARAADLADTPDGLVLVAEQQERGRGRLDRTWESPARAGLTFSMLVRPTVPTRAWPWLPLLVGYAVDKVLKARGLDAGLKWPNDVLVGEEKVAGLLVERIETPQGPAAVVGVGLNVSQTREELPVPHATSVELALGEPVDRTDLLIEILNAIREAFDAWEAGGDDGGMRLAESYAAACRTVGQRVRVDLPGGAVLEGEAVAIDPAGQLVVDVDGVRHAVSAGDVMHVRATR
ncbi:biotin--[acetyl-CoA-carboxylase] ligase [Nocardioides sp. R-C-SC26]|uniref:biotin--[acetyl-CoA-carboxylase] ligase n=1 Tax=Nocardioides sp. R-C-SC26 TaxID=2870414 RepID=UPI001E525A29|nr:biotin--[acetyl-CoA-carboxylase] ligase [Nocardioides sp. R-C-SC26]